MVSLSVVFATLERLPLKDTPRTMFDVFLPGRPRTLAEKSWTNGKAKRARDFGNQKEVPTADSLSPAAHFS